MFSCKNTTSFKMKNSETHYCMIVNNKNKQNNERAPNTHIHAHVCVYNIKIQTPNSKLGRFAKTTNNTITTEITMHP